MPGTRLGLFASFNEDDNGPISKAVRISRDFGCFTWFDRTALDPTKLDYPTGIVVRVSGKEEYYRGVLLSVQKAPEEAAAQKDLLDRERNHCLAEFTTAYKTVLYIFGLRPEARKPSDVASYDPPQHPTYKLLKWDW